jgi:hypothetical protein
MTTIPKCQAKGGPASCTDPACPEKQFHAAISQAARQRVLEASNRIVAAVNSDQMWAAKTELETAQFDYFATREGIQSLKDQLATTTDTWEQGKVEANLAMAQERFDAKYSGTVVKSETTDEDLIPAGPHTYDVPTYTKLDEDSMYPKTIGSKAGGEYRKFSEIKKDIMNDLKKAQEANYLPKGVKFSARVPAGGWTPKIYVSVQGLPDEKIFAVGEDQWGRYTETLTPDAKELTKRIEGIVGAYNVSATNSQIDYFQETYYQSVDLETSRSRKYRLEEAERGRQKRQVVAKEQKAITAFKTQNKASWVKDNKPVWEGKTKDGAQIGRVAGTKLIVVETPQGVRAFRQPTEAKADRMAATLTRFSDSNLDYYSKFEVK